MDVLEIVIAELELPTGPGPGAEIVINGTPLADLVEKAEDLDGAVYAPLAPDELRAALQPPNPGETAEVRVLGCGCGTPGCSWVALAVAADPDGQMVRWSDVTTSRHRPEAASVGPFRFDGEQYAAALASPLLADRPLRPYGDD
jgi:hypothetical protein